jgi:hypothetical protein
MIYSIKGTVVNGPSQDPIKGAKISISPVNLVFTDTNGNFTITGNIPESGSLSMTISAAGHEFIEPPLYKGNGTLKTNLGILQLQPIVSSLNQEKIKSTQLSKDQIKELSTSKKDSSYYAEEKLSNQINIIKNTLTPAILTMLAGFGITQVSKYKTEQLAKILDQSTCPTQPELVNLINRKNKLVKQLKNIYNVIDITTKSLGITTELIGLLNQSNQAYNTALLSIPSSTGVPGVPGLPVGVITQLDDTKDTNKDNIQKLTQISVSILSILTILKQSLTQAIQLLSLLDKLVEKCYPNSGQEQISNELIALTIQQTTQTSPLISEYNGFKLSVETEPTTNPLKRRRAIAQNKQNVVMLKGEWSFSSIDQILIDELIFYIQQNDLKAD